MKAFDGERSIPRQNDCACAFAQNHSALVLIERLNRGRQTKQSASPLGVTREPIALFRPHHKAMVKWLTRHEVFSHFYRCEPNRSVAHQSISSASDTENRREVACRGIEDSFGKQQ